MMFAMGIDLEHADGTWKGENIFVEAKEDDWNSKQFVIV